MTNKRSFLLGIAFVLCSLSIYGQANQPFDCISAQLICAPEYVEADNFSTSPGEILDEIKDGETCMFDRDERGIVWYTFKVNNTGNFGFIITPNNIDDDYDWVLFDLTNATCEDLANNPADLMVSCNAAGGPGCHGATGMDVNALYNVQGGGCDVEPPTANAGFSSLNAFVPVVQGNTYVLAVQNWTFVDEGRSQGYEIDFSSSINTGIIDTEAPVVTEVVGGPSICDNEPIIVKLNENISCVGANSITATLTGPDGSTIQGQVFAADCLRGATGVKDLVITADFRGATPGDYIVTLDDTTPNRMGLRDGCENVIALPVSFDVFLAPDLSLNVNIRNRTPNNDVCEGDVVVLRAEESFDFLGTNHLYEWTLPDGSTFVGHNLNATRPGVYTVDVLQNGARPQPGCRRGTATYTIEGGVLIDLGPNRSGICEGDAQTLTAQAGGTNYTWSTGQSGRSLRQITVTESGTYTVTVETDCGDVEDSITIEYDEIPYTVDQTNFSICPGESVTIGGADIGGGASYSWSNGATTPTTSVSTVGTYIVTIRQNGCTTNRTINVTASDVPDVSITGPSNVCPDDVANLAANDLNNTGATFSWNTGRTGPILSGVGVGTYTVTAISSQGCEETATATISAHSVAQATINGNDNFSDERCAAAGQTALIASAGTSYQWSNGSTGRSIQVASGSFNVVVTDANGCTSTAMATVTENPQPNITLPASATANCSEDRQSYSINVTVTNANQVQTAGGLGTVTDNGNGTYTISAIPQGQDVVVIAQNAEGCESTSDAFEAPACECATIAPPNIVDDITICQGDPIPPLSATTAVGDAVIRWFDSPSSTTPIFTGNSFTQTTAGTYFAEVHNTISDCQSARVPITLTINELPIATITGQDLVCLKGATTTPLSASLVGGGATAFQWSSTSGGTINSPSSLSITAGVGTYSVEVTDSNGCKATDNITIGLHSVIEATINGTTTVCPGETTTLSASTGQSYLWSVNNENGQDVIVGEGAYMVTVTDTNGCESEASETVTLNDVPTITTSTAATCADDRQTYSVQISTEAANTITPTNGIVSGGGGFFTIRDIPTGEDIIVIARTPNGCEDTASIEAPTCGCDDITAPASAVGNEQTICSNEEIPALIINTASLGVNEVIRWYDRDTGGTPLATGPSFTPTAAGTYFAEIHDELSNCQSPRTSVRLVINPTPTAIITGDVLVCPEGETTTTLSASLAGGGASSFQWSGTNNISNSTNANVDVGVGVYSVIVTDNNNCSDESEPINITEFDVTQATITGELAVCPDETTILRTSGGRSYAWSNGGTGDNITNIGPDTYTVVVTDFNGCESTASASVTENAAPTINIPADAASCAGDLLSYTVEVNTEPGNTITATDGTVTGGGGFFSVRDIPANTNITVTATTADGCTDTRDITAIDCNCPSIAAPASNTDEEICADEAIPTLNVSATLDTDEELRWYDVSTGGTALATGPNFTPEQAGTYFAEVYNTLSNCFSQRTPVRLTIHALPEAVITGDEQVCPDVMTNLTASLRGGGAMNFQWSASANGSNNSNVTVGVGMHSVVVTDANRCSDDASIEIREFSVSPVEITGQLAVCPDEQTTLTASGSLNYTWSNSDTGNTTEVGAGTHEVVGIDGNGCEERANATVNENDLPNIDASAAAVCAEDLLTYSVQIVTDADNTISPTAGTVTGGGGFFTVTDIPANTNITVTATTPDGCTDTRGITAIDCNCPSMAAPSNDDDRAICADEPIPALSVSVTLAEDEEIRWYDVSTDGTALATGLNFTPTAAGTYFAEVYNTVNNCFSQRTPVRLTINALPEAVITGDEQVCPDLMTTLTASLQGGGAMNFQWSADANSATRAEVTVGEGTYSVVVTDANGCADAADISINEFSVMQAEIAGDLSVCPDDMTTLTTSGGTYQWSNGETSDNITVSDGTHSVTVTDTNGCQSEDMVVVDLNDVPIITLPTDATVCDDDLLNYSVRVNVAADDILTVNGGIGTVTGAGGFFTIQDIPAGQDITVTVQNTAGCTAERAIMAIDCTCPSLAAPISNTTDVAICADEPIPALVVSAAGIDNDSEVRWYNTATGGTDIARGLAFTPTAAGTYFAEVYNTVNNCQSQRTEIRFVINDVPTANIVGVENVCPGLTTELTANLSAGTIQTYQWSASANSSLSPSVEVGEGAYSVILTDENGCVAEDQHEIRTFEVIPAEITGDNTVCPDESTTLTASAGASYDWGNFGTNQEVTVPLGSYMVTVTDANGCESVASEMVTQDDLPTVSLVDEILNCSDDLESYNFSINTGTDNTVTASLGTVSGSGGFFTISEVPKDIPVTIIISNPSTGCELMRTFNAPNCECAQFAAPTSMGDMEVCADAAIPALSVSGAGLEDDAEIRWYDSPVSTTVLGVGVNFTPQTGGSYFAEIYNTVNDCTSPRTEVRLTIYDLPVATIAGENNVCPDLTTELTVNINAGTIQSYQWSVEANNVATPSVTVGRGTYSVTITDENGCVAEDNFTIDEFTVAPASITGDLTVCPDGNGTSTTTLTASAGASYEWSNFAETESIEVGEGTYTVTILDENDCESEATVGVTEDTAPMLELVNGVLPCAPDLTTYSLQINTEAGNDLSASLGTVSGTAGVFTISDVTAGANITISITNPITGCTSEQSFDAPDCTCPTLAAPQSAGNEEICADMAIPALSVSSPDLDDEAEIRWYDTPTAGVEIGTGITFAPTAAGVYYAEVYNTTTNCQSPRTEVTLIINDVPTANITGETAVCPDGTTELSASLIGTNAASFLWSTGETTATINGGVDAYSVTITDINGCTAEEQHDIIEFEVAQAEITGNLAVCPDGTTSLTASAGASYEWSNSFDTDNNIDAGVGISAVTITDTNGCLSEASVEVTENSVPSITLVDGLLPCSSDRATYSFQISTETDNNLTASQGTVSGSNGLFTVEGVLKDTPVTITLTNSLTNCESTQEINAPNCDCPTVAAPPSTGDMEVCEGLTIPALSVDASGVDDESEIRWYDSATSSTAIATGASFMPTAAGSYFAEIIHIESSCTSPRTEVRLTVHATPTGEIAGTPSVCPGETTALTASLVGEIAQSISWSSSAASATDATVEVVAGVYSVSITDENGCETVESIVVEELSPVVAMISGDNTVCPGEMATLTASGGETYEWSEGTQTEVASLAVGDYSVTVTDANGCQDITSIEVTEDALPSLTLSTSAACASDLLSYGLEITTEDGNMVTTDVGTVTMTGGIASITGIEAGTDVAVTITNATTGCMTMQTFQAPNCDCPSFAVITTSGDEAICDGDAIPTFTANSEDLNEMRVLRWFDADIAGNELARGADFTPSAAGTYFVEVFEESSNCTSARIAVTLTINALPNAAIDGPTDICPDETATITASGGTTYTWNNGDTTESIEVAAGDYDVMVSDANGCSESASISINAFTVAEAMVTGDTGVCPDETTMLTASAGVNFLWDTGDRTQMVEVGRGMYTVLIEDANGCQSEAMVEVIEDPLPSYTVAQQANCSPDLTAYSVQIQTDTDNSLTTTAGTLNDLGSGLWEISNIDVTTAIVATITNNTTGCTTDAPFEAPNCNCPSLAAPTSDGDAIICSDEAIPALTVTNSDQNLVVNWYDAPAGGNLVGTGASFTPTEAGTYYAEVEEEVSNCTSLRTEVSLTINALPDVSIAASAEGACGNDSVTLTASGADSYTWSSSDTGESIDVTPGTYTLTGTDANGCSNTADVSIAAFPTPTVSVDAPEFICGEEFDIVTATGGDTYLWSTGETTPSVQLGEGAYSVTASNADGCTDELAFDITAVTEASADLGADQVLCSDQTLQLSPGSFPAGSMLFEWSDGSTSETLAVTESGQYRVTVTDMCDGEAIASVNVDIVEAIDQDLLEIALGQDTTNCPGTINFNVGNTDLGNVGTVSYRWQDGSNQARFSTAEEGTVTLTATNECGDVSATVEIEACKECTFYKPNAFSPDGKGNVENETFKIFSNCEDEITNFQMKIFDRWGGLVFETTSMDESWDGMFNGTRPVSDAFVWIVTYDLPDRYGNIRSQSDSGEFIIKE